ncbi:MAG: PP2C family protein-serine/threonine phosphatase [Lachnospiraceae bacterium]|nr:PP2C family protein-serine/threonine phosphatase [Lachnospiraceae bacterium]
METEKLEEQKVSEEKDVEEQKDREERKDGEGQQDSKKRETSSADTKSTDSNKTKKRFKRGLGFKFGLFYVIFALVMIVVSSLLTFLNQSNSYHQECERNLRQITAHLAELMAREGDEFAIMRQYFEEHPDRLLIPLDFQADLEYSGDAFASYIAEHYPGQVYGDDLYFEDMDDTAQQLYIIWSFEYWFDIFYCATEEFGLEYIYYIYPSEQQENGMIYLFDPAMETKIGEDGKEYLVLGTDAYQDPEKDHKYMWQAWKTGVAPDGFDSVNNEFGYVYTYCMPVWNGTEKMGLICADLSVYFVNSAILESVIKQAVAMIIILLVGILILSNFMRETVLKRIIRLESAIRKYSDSKNVEISDKIREKERRPDELTSLSNEFADMIVELRDYMEFLKEVTAEKERIGAELSVATQIQADMLPRIFPAFPERDEFDIYATMDPAKEVGGDFYDFFLIDDDHLVIVVADVSGKGVPAALFMVIAKSLIKNRMQMGEAPGEALANVNNQLLEGNEAGLFVTVWMAVIDLNTGHAIAVNAGHEKPAIRRKGGQYELIRSKHSPAVATLEGMRYRETEFDLEPGDFLYQYSDGVPEATNKNDELFTTDRMLEALNKNPDAEPEEQLRNVRIAINEFVGDAPQFDDITMLGLHFYGKGGRNEGN